MCVCDPYAAGPGANVQDEEGTDAHDHQHSNDDSPVGCTSPTTTRLPQLLRVRPSLWHIDLLLTLHARLLVVLLATCMHMQRSRLIHSLTTRPYKVLQSTIKVQIKHDFVFPVWANVDAHNAVRLLLQMHSSLASMDSRSLLPRRHGDIQVAIRLLTTATAVSSCGATMFGPARAIKIVAGQTTQSSFAAPPVRLSHQPHSMLWPGTTQPWMMIMPMW